MKQKVLILTEGSHHYGLGHVARMRALAEAFIEKDYDVQIIVDGDSSVDSILKGLNYQLLPWKKQFTDVKQKLKENIVVVDSYTASEELYGEIAKLAKLKIYFDDFVRIHYPPGIVVNPTLGAEELNYPSTEDVKYLLGPKYLPLRKPFWKEPNKRFNKEIKTILVQFGGDDIKEASPKVTEFLASKYPSSEIDVIVGKAFKKSTVEKLKALDKKFKNIRIHFAPSGEEIADLMTKADIGIVAAGLMTVYEALSRGLPLITVITMENQVDVLQRLIKRNLVLNAGWFNDKNLFSNLEKFIRELQPVENRKQYYFLGRSVIDGKGATRLVSFVKNLLRV